MTGYSNGNFGPNDNISRAQVATILDRYNQKEDQKLTDLFMAFQGTNLTTLHTQVPHEVALILAQAGLFADNNPPDLSVLQPLSDQTLPSGWTVYGPGQAAYTQELTQANAKNDVVGYFYLENCPTPLGYPYSGATIQCYWFGPFQGDPNAL